MTTMVYESPYITYGNYNSSNGTYGNYGNNGNYGVGTYSGSVFTTQGLESYKQRVEYSQEANNLLQGINNKQNAEKSTVQFQCENITQMIKEGRENDILGEYNKLLDLLKGQPQYEGLNEAELKATARNLFQQSTGVSLTEAIEQNCSGTFGTGFKQGFFLSNADGVTKDDLLSEINGTPKKGGPAKVIGNILGGICGILTLGIPALFGEHG